MPLIEPGRISSDLTLILTTAFDNAWAKFKASGSALAGEGYAPLTRDLLAKRIIKTAQNGERDTNRLVDDGIAYLSELNNSRWRDHADTFPVRRSGHNTQATRLATAISPPRLSWIEHRPGDGSPDALSDGLVE
jgi:hypothetical protein